jgi:hypothetical protein
MSEENNVNHGVAGAGPPCAGVYAADEGNSGTGCGKLTSFFIWHFIFKKGS